MRSVRVVIIDRNSVTRRGYRTLIEEVGPPNDVVASFEKLREFETYSQQYPVDVVILDDQTLHPVEVTQWINQCYDRLPGLSIVIISMRKAPEYIQGILKHGTAGFVYRNGDFDMLLLTAVRMAAAKQPFVSSEVVRSMMLRKFTILSQLDLDVLHLMDHGQSVKDISKQLGTSSRSIYRAREKLKHALGVQTLEQIIDAARRQGWLDGRAEPLDEAK